MKTNATVVTRWTPVIRTVGVSLALGLLLVLGAASAHAEETQPTTQKPEPQAASTDSTVGPVEGIRVRGHWTIEVRDPDGTLVERREFENALVIPAGAALLAQVMARSLSIGGWRVELHLGPAGQICDDGSGNPLQCVIVESTDPSVALNNYFGTLTFAVSVGQIELTGSAVAQRNGDIGDVATFNLVCGGTVAPATCPGDPTGNVTDLTATTLATPVAVLTGQQVQVNVVISLSRLGEGAGAPSTP